MSTYGFIGLGLIGGSIAQKLKVMDPAAKIFVSTRSEAAKEAAKTDGVMDGEFTPDGSDVPLDMIFLCAPVEANLELLKRLAKWVPETCTISDVGSVKTPILQLAEELRLPNFVGGHPMMGTEFSGYKAAKLSLLKNAVYLVLPTACSAEAHTKRLSAFIESLEAVPLIVPGSRHDMAVAAISHLPHVVSAALTNTAADTDRKMFPEAAEADQASPGSSAGSATPGENLHAADAVSDPGAAAANGSGDPTANRSAGAAASGDIALPVGLRRLSAGGFRDITRISSSSPSLWAEISLENRENVLAMLDAYQEELDRYRKYLTENDLKGLEEFFRCAKTYRDSIPPASR